MLLGPYLALLTPVKPGGGKNHKVAWKDCMEIGVKLSLPVEILEQSFSYRFKEVVLLGCSDY